MAGRRRATARAADGARAAARAASVAAAGAGSAAASAAGLSWSGAKALARGLGWLAARPEVQRLVLGGALLAGVAAATQEVRGQVESWPRFELDRTALRTSELPASLSARARQDLERLPLPTRPGAPASAGPSIFDARLVPCAAAGLERLPWVERVEAVRLEAPARLTFSLVCREPVARLEREGDGLLTRDVAVIPMAYAAAPDALPRLIGIPGPGALVLRRRALEAAVRVIDELGPELRREVRAIDLTNLDGRADPLASEVVLLLDGDLPVEWGRAPEVASPGRPTIEGETKRAALRALLQDGPPRATLARVSVRWDETTYVLKPAAPTASAGEVAQGPARQR